MLEKTETTGVGKAIYRHVTLWLRRQILKAGDDETGSSIHQGLAASTQRKRDSIEVSSLTG